MVVKVSFIHAYVEFCCVHIHRVSRFLSRNGTLGKFFKIHIIEKYESTVNHTVRQSRCEWVNKKDHRKKMQAHKTEHLALFMEYCRNF